jgi:hypothetical protein
MKLGITFVLFPLLLAMFAAEAEADMTANLREFLVKQIHLNQHDIENIESGKSVARALRTEKREEIAIFGIIRMKASPDYFLSKFRNIVQFESGSSVMESGMFSLPPQRSDVSNLNWETKDLKNLRECKSRTDGCGIRLPGISVADVQKKIDWSTKNVYQQANDLLRNSVIDFVNRYQREGDNALPVYKDKNRTMPVKDGLHLLMQNSPYLVAEVPQLFSYLQNFPNEKNSDAEDLFYWQKGDFGLQPVIRISHVVILKVKEMTPVTYAIASKMLYANHYFRDGLELRLLLPDPEGCEGCGFYFLVLNRSHVDGMTGLRGWLIRGSVVDKSVKQLDKLLTNGKARLENDYHNSSSQPLEEKD